MTRPGEWNAARTAYLHNNPRHERLAFIAAYPNRDSNRYWPWPVEQWLKALVVDVRKDFVRGWISGKEFHDFTKRLERQIAIASDEAARSSWERAPDPAPDWWIAQRERSLRREGRGVGRESWCIEYVDRYGWRALADWKKKEREALEEWQRREAIAEQKRHLREGAETLKLLRRHLRSPGQSPLLESRPERTSPI